jgi:hypothetical protein
MPQFLSRACALANPQSPNPGSKASRQPDVRRQENAAPSARLRKIPAAMRFSPMAHGLHLMGIARLHGLPLKLQIEVFHG